MKALIITDGTDVIHSIASLIKDNLSGFNTIVLSADKFDGTELLAADFFFIGCENPSPSSFNFLEEMLSHINLASRKCAVFSVKTKTIKYLRGIIKPSEAGAAEPFVSESFFDFNNKANETEITKWLKSINI